ncbi:MAG TPA: LuxR C-terminal-related transcriptional regulator [Streptosporangiaceae bacterium]|jgi:DNA-binding NarL/FixJ family response regulator
MSVEVIEPAGTATLDCVAVSVLGSGDHLAGQVEAGLRAAGDIRVLPGAAAPDADVVLVLGTTVTEGLLAEMTRTWKSATNPGQALVLVAGPLRERQLARVFNAGVVSILPRREATVGLIVRAVLASSQGRAVLPASITRWLIEESRAFQQEMLTSHGIEAGGLTAREIAVLRGLAEGMDTARIGRELNFSERTIKKVIADVLARLHLRSRAHAVSYALRVGAF